MGETVFFVSLLSRSDSATALTLLPNASCGPQRIICAMRVFICIAPWLTETQIRVKDRKTEPDVDIAKAQTADP